MRTWVCLHDCYIYCTSMLSHICIVAPHIGTLAETCEGSGVGAKLEDVFGGSISMMEELESAWRRGVRQAGFT
jgi:hypothetical protein